MTFAARMNRVLWLGLCVALRSEHLEYNLEKKWFCTPASAAVKKQTTPAPAPALNAPVVTPSKPASRLRVKLEDDSSDRPSDYASTETMIFDDDDDGAL